MKDLMITNVPISRDAAGRYSLNDLYRASGGADRHSPFRWLRNADTKALIAALERRALAPNMVSDRGVSDTKFGAAPVAVEATRNPGTYVVKQLVYAYAEWISPDFHIDVIEAYDSLVTGRLLDTDDRRRTAEQQVARLEARWLATRPHWTLIRLMANSGTPTREISAVTRRSPASVRRAIGTMITRGLIDPVELAQCQKGPAKRAAQRRIPGAGKQLALDL